jgi:tRNA nucleotidyltransferase (CCA-adding enzyme)
VAGVDFLAELESDPVGLRVLEIGRALEGAGGRAVLVGGAVRDALMERDVSDLDVEVFGLEPAGLDAVLAEFGEVLSIGRAFGVSQVAGLDVDFSLPRRDSKTGPGHRGFSIDVDPQLDFAQAARRRDLTINAMGVELVSGALLDPYDGQRDIANRKLRATDPLTFPEDPLRGLRVAQFAARFGFDAVPELVELCASLDLSELPGERLAGEFEKLLCKGVEPSRGLAFLRESRLLRFFPELAALIGVEQDPQWHPEGDVWVHTLLCVDRAAQRRTGDANADAVVMFGTLCHDFGKPSTTEHVDGRIRSRGHEGAGIEPTLAFCDRLRMSAVRRAQVAALVEHHLAPALLIENRAGDRGYRRLARRLADVGLTPQLLELTARADHLGRTTQDARDGVFPAGDRFLERIEQLSLSGPPPRDVVLGRHLIAAGLEPSPEFGEILNRCREIQDETGSEDADAILARALNDRDA